MTDFMQANQGRGNMKAKAYIDAHGLHIERWNEKLERNIEVEFIPSHELPPDERARELLAKDIAHNWSR